MKTFIVRSALVAAGALAGAGCTSNGYNHHHGYAGLSYGYASPYYGWYDDYYYPGSGFYVYDRSGSRHRWNDHQRDYWQSHHGNHDHGDNWSGYQPGHGRDHDYGSGHHRDRDHDHDHGNGNGNGNHHGHHNDGDSGHDRGDNHHHRR